MTIVSVAWPLAPVAPDTAGGAEQVLSVLEEELVRRGHRSRVIAAQGSRVAGRLRPIPLPEGVVGEEDRRRAREAVEVALRETLREPADVVHLHGLDFPEYREALDGGPPAVATLHLPPAWYRREAFGPGAPERLVCVSESQRRGCPPEAGPLRVIPNGVPDRLREVRVRRRGFALALGRICPEKGYEFALQACEAAGVPLWIAGRAWAYREHQEYLQDVLSPRVRAPHRLLGAVGGPRKARMLAAARCLVIASKVTETSSLAAMEALACGTPVVATAVGALPEIVDHGRTGFLARNARELAEGIARAGTIDPEACREEAARRFSARRMADEYLELYEECAAERWGARRAAS